ncbi:hypothetical protein [Neobacillus vireti]|uniref:hypothetical protein n=1 Tax=Neobacillus vireti TaxID=220686 RepID=UPI003000D2E0
MQNPFLFTVVANRKAEAQPSAIQTEIYSIHEKESITDEIELYRGKPWALFLTVLLKEHETEDPNKFKGALEASTRAGAGALTVVIAAIPKVGPILAALSAPILQEGAKMIAEELSGLLNLEDGDRIRPDSSVM